MVIRERNLGDGPFFWIGKNWGWKPINLQCGSYSTSCFSSFCSCHQVCGPDCQDLDGGASYYEGEFKLFLRSGNGTLENTESLGSGCNDWPMKSPTVKRLKRFMQLKLLLFLI
jgi:hypothetical protein